MLQQRRATAIDGVSDEWNVADCLETSATARRIDCRCRYLTTPAMRQRDTGFIEREERAEYDVNFLTGGVLWIRPRKFCQRSSRL